MTAKRDLKRRARARQRQTGEPYTAALAGVRSGAEPPASEPPSGDEPPAVPVVELADLCSEAERHGFRARVLALPGLLRKVSARAALTALAAALEAAEGDSRARIFRRALLSGEGPTADEGAALQLAEDGRDFVARARAGLGGFSLRGYLLLLHVAGRRGSVPMTCLLWPSPPIPSHRGARPPTIVLATSDSLLSTPPFVNAPAH